MKKRAIWISVAIIAAAILLLYSYSQGTGYIKIEASGFETDLNLRGRWGRKTISVSGSEPVEISAGIYKPERIVLRKTKDADKWWSILSRRGLWGELAAINIVKGKTTVLKLGPPLEMRTDIQRSGQNATIGLSLIGRASEHWSPQVLTYDGPQTAKLKIIDEAGKVLAADNFKYG
jgi:hypothetical protein